MVGVEEIWVEWCVVLVDFVYVVVGCIGLLYFDECVVYRFVVFVEYVVGDDYLFVEWFVVFYGVFC